MTLYFKICITEVRTVVVSGRVEIKLGAQENFLG